jgi:transmembrane sensor
MTDFPSSHADTVDRAREWVVRLGAGDITRAELASLRDWIAEAPENARAFEQERALWQDLAVIAPAFGEAAPPRRRVRQALGGAIAASLLLMASGPQLYLMVRADYRTGTGERQTASLPDGSRVVLDTDSAIALAYDGNERRIDLLRGRAWFDVRHGDARPFRVLAQGGVTRDVGTAFAVERDGDAVDVGVSTGMVRVLAPQHLGDGLALKAGERVHYRPGGPAERLAATDSAEIAAWRTGALLLRDMPIARAIHEIGRYRAAPIVTFGDLDAAPPVSGVFRTDQPDDALATIAAMRRLRVYTLPGGILVVRPGTRS